MANLLSRTLSTSPESDDVVYICESGGPTDGKVEIYDVFSVPITTHTVINFNNSQTRYDIQTIINNLPRLIRIGVQLTLQFADGTYNLDDQINIQGFYGGGSLFIQGNTSETYALHTNQAVHLNFNNDTVGIYCRGNSLGEIRIQYLKITAQDKECVTCQWSSYYVVENNYCIVTGTTVANQGVIHLAGNVKGRVQFNYINGGYYGIRSSVCSIIDSYLNDDTGTQPVYGLRANTGSMIGKREGQPTGSTADESIVNGGAIR